MLILSMKILPKNQCLYSVFILLMILQISVQTPVNTTVQVLIVSRNGTVNLCKNEGAENSKFNLTLEKGNNKEVVCLVYSTREKTNFLTWKDKPECHFNSFNGTFFLTLTNLDVEHSDSYTCRMEFFVPPPFKTFVTRTFIYVHGAPHYDMSNFVIWILSAVASFLLLCCIIMIYITLKRKHCRECEAKKLSKESNSEYMHMAAVPLVRPPMC